MKSSRLDAKKRPGTMRREPDCHSIFGLGNWNHLGLGSGESVQFGEAKIENISGGLFSTQIIGYRELSSLRIMYSFR